MSELRLSLSGRDLDAITPELSWQGSAVRAEEPVDLRLDSDDLKDLQWLWEDPSVDLYQPGSGRRLRAEQGAERVGQALGQAFAASEAMRSLLAQALAPGNEPVVLITSERDDALFLPWELARTPSGRHLSSAISGLARQRLNVPAPMIPARTGDRLRVLLLVSRPEREEDVEYQAIAIKLLDRLEGRAEVKLVRPGTFKAFERELSQRQWDLVHYDGHGVAGKLAFEDGPVTAERLGQVLAGARVPVFALNACQSAMAEGGLREEREVASVAQALVHTGAVGVIAMGASVRVSSAVTFFDRFYAELGSGATLARAAHRARRAIEAGQGHGPLDWAIPVLYLKEDVAPFRGPPTSSPNVIGILQGFAPAPAATTGQKAEIFIGRDGDLYRVDRAVDEAPRVLLYGVGGVGKTTLTEYLLQWRKRTGGAERVVDFSFRRAPSLESLVQRLQQVVAEVHPEVLPMFQSPQWAVTALRDRLERLGQVLAAEGEPVRMFLFDNLETLGGYPEVGSGPYTDEDRDDFRALLRVLGGERCRVVLTSRRDELELLGDIVVRLRLVGLKGRYRLLLLQAYTRVFDAEKMLRGALQDEERKHVLADLLRTLAGHPLATRVAAYGLRDRTVAEVLASIQGKAHQIEVPISEHGTRSESLEQVLAGVLEPLPEERQRALGILGLFSGQFHESDLFQLVAHKGFPAGVVDDRSEGALRRVLTEAHRLGLMAPSDQVDKVWEVVPGAQSALDRLWREALDAETARELERHSVRYWATMASTYEQALHSREQAQWAVVFGGVDEGNLRRALELAEREHEWEAARPILSLLLELWPMRGRIKDADHLRSEWLKRVSNPQGHPVNAADAGVLALWYLLQGDEANRHLDAGKLDEAWAVYRRIVDTFESVSERGVLPAAGYHQLGMVEQMRGRLDAAEEWYQKSLKIKEELGNRPGMALTYHQLGILEQMRGRLDAAEEWYQKSLKIKEELGNRPGMASTYHQLGMVGQHRGRLDAAEEWYQKSLKIEEELGNTSGMAESYHQLGMVEQMRGRLDAAEEWYRKSLKIKEELGNRFGMVSSYHQLGMVEQDRGRLDAAEEWYRKSLKIEEDLGNRPQMASSCHQIGMVEQMRGRLDVAEEWYRKSLKIREELGNRPGMAASYQQLGIVEQMRGRSDMAEEWYRESLTIREELGNRPGIALIHGQLGLLFQERGDLDSAVRYMISAFAIFAEIRSPEVNLAARTLYALYRTLGQEVFTRTCTEAGAPKELMDVLLRAFEGAPQEGTEGAP